MTDLEWANECKYISKIASAAHRGGLGREFNYDVECFKRYCVMQRNSAAREKFFDAEVYIQQCLDDLEHQS